MDVFTLRLARVVQDARPNSPAVTLMTEEEKDLGKTKIQVTDLVLAVRTTMPCLKEDWVKEKQNTTKWLTQDQLKRLKDMR